MRTVLLLLALLLPLAWAQPEAAVRHVILISVDGLRGDAIDRLGPDLLPTLHRLRAESAGTDNARTDPDFTVTLPNHVGMITGLPTLGAAGHGWTGNGTPGPNETVHSRRGSHAASVFDAVHERGLATALFAGKSKFVLFEQSYRDAIDTFLLDSDTPALMDAFLAALTREHYAFAFLHLRDPDGAGHDHGFDPLPGRAYAEALVQVDREVARLLSAIENDEELAGTTVIILTSDHGGDGRGHGDAGNPENFTVPFYVWGAGIAPGDLYALAAQTRAEPGTARPGREASPPPIRNSDAADLALALLGLPPLTEGSLALPLAPP